MNDVPDDRHTYGRLDATGTWEGMTIRDAQFPSVGSSVRRLVLAASVPGSVASRVGSWGRGADYGGTEGRATQRKLGHVRVCVALPRRLTSSDRC